MTKDKCNIEKTIVSLVIGALIMKEIMEDVDDDKY